MNDDDTPVQGARGEHPPDKDHAFRQHGIRA